jgi:hypothetical protein
MTASSLVKTFWVMHYIEVQNFVFHNIDFMGIKRCRILRRFQKYKLTLVTKCTQKKIFQDKDFPQYTGGPLCSKENPFS